MAPQSSIQVRPAIHLLRPFLSFSIYPPSFFSSCFLFWHGYSAIRTSLQFSRPNSSNDFIELGWCLWGFVLFINNIYKLFYVLPFFDNFSVVEFISIYLKSSFRYVDILWHSVQTGGFQNLNTSSVYCRSCLKHI